MSRKDSKRLTIEDRARIIERLENGGTVCKLADEYGVTPSAISQLKKNRENILLQKQILEQCGSSTKRKRYTGIESTAREKSLYTWMTQKRDVGDAITGPTLVKQALVFNQALQGSCSFKASAGFLHKFKKRYSLNATTMQRGKSSAGSVTRDEFSQWFPEFCREHGFGLDQVYRAGETELYWKMLPNCPSVKSTDYQASERRVPKDRVTVMVCSNVSGTHKIPLLVIGKSQMPRRFESIRYLSVECRRQKSGGITKDLTLDWYKTIFLPAIREKHEGQKIVLVLDNSPIYPKVEEFEVLSGDMCTVIVPLQNQPIQAMDRGVIGKMKKVYKRNLLRIALTSDTDHGAPDAIEMISMFDVCHSLAHSWDQVTQRDIRYGWGREFPPSEEHSESVDSDELSGRHILNLVRALPGCSEATDEDIEEWLNSDARDPEWEMVPPHEDVKEEKCDEEREVSEDEGVFGECEALKALNYVMGWYRTTQECTPIGMGVLGGMKEQLITTISSSKIEKINSSHNDMKK
ncbi:jerky protein homolog-like isoform X2 [Diachasma alloeum]|nr:jerky protein homolog-like isoform X2 [Diachasma alloeum]